MEQRDLRYLLKNAGSPRGLAGKLAFLNRKLTGGDISISVTAIDRSNDEAMATIEHFRPIR